MKQPPIAKGFSLVEMMIVVAIIAILTVVAFPSYQQYLLESRRSDARIALTLAAAEQERFYSNNGQYSTDINILGGNTSLRGFYTLILTINIDSVDSSTYSLTAFPPILSPQRQDINCHSFTINHLGQKNSSNSNNQASTDCW